MQKPKSQFKIIIVSLLILFLMILPSFEAIETRLDGDGDVYGVFKPEPEPAGPSESAEIMNSLNYKNSVSEFTSNNPQKISTRPRKFPKNHPMNDYSDVLVIVNENSSISKQIGQYFKEQRNVPDKNMCIINTSNSESIDFNTFHDLRSQVEDHIENNDLKLNLNYLVTTKGMPLRITHGTWTRRASVDSELCLILGLYSQYIDNATSTKIANRYFNKDYQFSKLSESIYLVTRLTGYNFTDVKQLIDNAAASANQQNAGGTFLFDRDPWKTGGSVRAGNSRMSTAHNTVSGRNFPSGLDNTGSFITDRTNRAGYVSWGSFDANYWYTPLQNRGFDSPNNELIHTPTNWEVHYKPGLENITRNVTINQSSRFSINITRTQNDTGFTFLSQNVTIKAGVRYFASGYVRLVDVVNYDGGGAILQLTAYNGANDIVWQVNSTRRYGGPSAWTYLYQIPYEPIPGVTKLRVAVGITKSMGTAFFDDIGLWEIRPHNSYVPGAIAETYGYSTAYTMTNPHWFYRLTVGDLIMDGITGVKGYVDYTNSYIDTNTRVNVLFERYTDSFCLADSYYMATPYLSWLDVVIGDPKCSPYFNLLPDVAIKTKNITFSDDLPNQGDEIKINANIENLGGSHIYNFNVTFLVGNNYDNAKKIKTVLIPFVGSEGSQWINITWNTSKYKGNQTIWVEVESDLVYREQNETNNIAANHLTINAYPFGIKIKKSKEYINRGESVDFTINISDNETSEEHLNISAFIKPNKDPSWTPFFELDYRLDHWYFKFISNATSILGWYNIKIVIKDENDAEINYEKNKVFKIQNNEPELGGLVVSKTSIYRTENLTINFTVDDFEDKILPEMLFAYLRFPGSDWYDFEFYIKQVSDIDWQITLVSNSSFKTGEYDIKIIIEDNDGAIVKTELLKAFKIINNLPVISQVTLLKETIYRSEIGTIIIKGYDIETDPGSMIVILQQRLSFESLEWSNDSIGAVKWVSKEQHWEGAFFTTEKSLTGNYSFRAQLIDADSGSTQFLESDLDLKVLNNPPLAVISVGVSNVNEDENIFFDSSNSTDLEDLSIYSVLWNFGDDTESSETKVYHSYSKSGQYNVSLTVTDKNFAKDIANVSITIRNIPPVAEMKIKASSSILKVGQSIEFNGRDSTDSRSDRINLTYLWDFDDGNTSTSANVTHVYSKPGTYIVKLTVTDDNGKTSSKIRDITVEPTEIIENGDEPVEEETNWFQSMEFIIVLVIIIIIILVSVIFFILKKKSKKGEDKARAEKPIETVEADMVGGPDLDGRTLEPGKTVKRTAGGEIIDVDLKPQDGKAQFKTSKSERIDAEFVSPKKMKELPPETVVGTSGPDVIDEVEVEYVPEVKVAAQQTEPTTEKLKPGSDTQTELGLDVHLPSDLDQDDDYDVTKDTYDDIDLPEPGSKPMDDADFVPPKIDLTGIIEPEEQPIQPHRHEISEAKSRGAGLDFDFKLPEAGKKKKKA